MKTSVVDGIYEIFSDGVIFKNNKPINTSLTNKGYLQCFLKNKHRLVHRIIASYFIPNPDNLPQVNHKDGNKLNNDVNNLEWITNLENIRHSFEIGARQSQKGGTNYNAKLTETEVIKIKKKLKTKCKKKLVKEYNISLSTIYNIEAGRSWKHVEIPQEE